MKTVFRALSIAALLAPVVACGLLKKADVDAGIDADTGDATAATDTPDSAPPPAAAALADNEGDVARFPDETAVASAPAKILRYSNVRDAPLTGAVVTPLGAGVTVTQIASRANYFLIVFANPKDNTKQLMGWVSQDAFSAVVDAGVKPLTCPTGQTALISDNTSFCGVVCTADTQCTAAGTACKGSAQKLVNNKAADTVNVCVVYTPPTQSDGGGLRRLHIFGGDAGPAPTPTTPVTPVTPAGTIPADVVAANGTTCPGGYTYIKKDNKCHHICDIKKMAADMSFRCTGAVRCIPCGAVTACAPDQSACK